MYYIGTFAAHENNTALRSEPNPKIHFCFCRILNQFSQKRSAKEGKKFLELWKTALRGCHFLTSSRLGGSCPAEMRRCSFSVARLPGDDMTLIIMTIMMMVTRSVTTGMLASQQVSRRMRRRAVSHNPKRLPRF